MLRTLIHNFNKLPLNSPVITQVREKGHLNRPRLRNPFWFIRKERLARDTTVTTENKSFIKEVIKDKYGPPSLIKGVQSYDQSGTLIKTEGFERKPWRPSSRRCGLLAKKIGQYPLWLKNGVRIRTTLLQIVDNHVIRYIPPAEYQPTQRPNVKNLHKYGCMLIGAESVDPTTLTKDYCGLFRDSGVMPKRNLARFLVTPDAAIPVGTPLNVAHFRVGDFVDIRGKTVYRGFQGVVKRHGFKGMPASHGVTKTHRRPGNIGGGGEKGRVWPGTKMPGHMGNRWRKAKGMRIWRINTKYNVMWVSGSSIPGPTNGLVYVYDTILPLRKHKTAPPFPTTFEDEVEKLTGTADDIWYEDVHNFKDDTITFQPETTN